MANRMTERQFYCVKCRKRVTLSTDDICFKNIKNSKMIGGNVPALVGKCRECNTNLTKFIKHDSAVTMKDKYGTC